MKAKIDLQPNLNIIKKYMPAGWNWPFPGTEFKFYDMFITKFNKSDFDDLLKRHSLSAYAKDLYSFAWFYTDTYYWSNLLLKDRIGKNDQSLEYNTELQTLAEFLHKNEITEIKLLSKNLPLKIMGPQIIWDLSKLLLEYVKTAKLKDTRLIETANFKKVFPRKKSVNKAYIKSYQGLFDFLRTETHLKDDKFTNEDIYNFIEEFCMQIGIKDLPTELRKYIK